MSIEIWDWGLGYIYLWDVLIAWWGWESWWKYTYDFTWKTTTQIYHDWWSRLWWTVDCGSDWLYWTNANINIPMPWNYDNARKITFKFLWKVWNSWSQDITFCTTSSSTSSQTNGFWVYLSYNNTNQVKDWTWNVNFNNTVNNSVVEYVYTLDLTNKKLKLTFIQWTSNEYERTLTDEKINAIKTNTYIQLFCNGSFPRISSVSISVSE